MDCRIYWLTYDSAHCRNKGKNAADGKGARGSCRSLHTAPAGFNTAREGAGRHRRLLAGIALKSVCPKNSPK